MVALGDGEGDALKVGEVSEGGDVDEDADHARRRVHPAVPDAGHDAVCPAEHVRLSLDATRG